MVELALKVVVELLVDQRRGVADEMTESGFTSKQGTREARELLHLSFSFSIPSLCLHQSGSNRL